MSRSHSFANSAIDLTEVAAKYDNATDTLSNICLCADFSGNITSSCITLEQVTDIDFTTNTPLSTCNLVLHTDGDGTYSFKAVAAGNTLCGLTADIDFSASGTSGNVLTSDGDGTFSFQETDTFGAIIYSLALG